MFLVVSRSDVQFGSEHPFFLHAQSGAQIKLRVRKIGRLERNLPTPDYRFSSDLIASVAFIWLSFVIIILEKIIKIN